MANVEHVAQAIELSIEVRCAARRLKEQCAATREAARKAVERARATRVEAQRKPVPEPFDSAAESM